MSINRGEILSQLYSMGGCYKPWNSPRTTAELKSIPKSALLYTLFNSVEWTTCNQERTCRAIVELFPERKERNFILRKLAAPYGFLSADPELALKNHSLLLFFKKIQNVESPEKDFLLKLDAGIFYSKNLALIPCLEEAPLELKIQFFSKRPNFIQKALSPPDFKFLNLLLDLYTLEPTLKEKISLPNIEITHLKKDQIEELVSSLLKHKIPLTLIPYKDLLRINMPLACLHPDCPKEFKKEFIEGGGIDLNQWITHTSIVKGFLRANAHELELIEHLLTMRSQGYNPLQMALIHNRQLVKPLLGATKGAIVLKRDLFQPDWLGNSPLHVSLLNYPQAALAIIEACEGQEELLELLMRPNSLKQTPFLLSIEKKWPTISNKLIEVSAKSLKLKTLLLQGSPLREILISNDTKLGIKLQTLIFGHHELTKLLFEGIESTAKFNIKSIERWFEIFDIYPEFKERILQSDEEENGPLHWLSQQYSEKSVEVFQFFVELSRYNPPLQKALFSLNKEGKSPYDLACDSNQIALADDMLDFINANPVLKELGRWDDAIESFPRMIEREYGSMTSTLSNFFNNREFPFKIANHRQKRQFIEASLKNMPHLVLLLENISEAHVDHALRGMSLMPTILINSLVYQHRILKFLLKNESVKQSIFNLKYNGYGILTHSSNHPESFEILLNSSQSYSDKQRLFSDFRIHTIIQNPAMVRLYCENLRGLALRKTLLSHVHTPGLVNTSLKGTAALIHGVSDSQEVVDLLIGPYIRFREHAVWLEQLFIECLSSGSPLSILKDYHEFIASKPMLIKVIKTSFYASDFNTQWKYLDILSPDEIKDFVIKNKEKIETGITSIAINNPKLIYPHLHQYSNHQLARAIPFLTDLSQLKLKRDLQFMTESQKLYFLEERYLLPKPFAEWDSNPDNPDFMANKRGLDSLANEIEINRLREDFKLNANEAFQIVIDVVFEKTQKKIVSIRAEAQKLALTLIKKEEIDTDERFIDLITKDIIEGEALLVPPLVDRGKSYYIGKDTLARMSRNHNGNVQHPMNNKWISPNTFIAAPEITSAIELWRSNQELPIPEITDVTETDKEPTNDFNSFSEE